MLSLVTNRSQNSLSRGNQTQGIFYTKCTKKNIFVVKLSKDTCSSESGEEFGSNLCNKDVVSTLAMDSLSASLPCVS